MYKRGLGGTMILNFLIQVLDIGDKKVPLLKGDF